MFLLARCTKLSECSRNYARTGKFEQGSCEAVGLQSMVSGVCVCVYKLPLEGVEQIDEIFCCCNFAFLKCARNVRPSTTVIGHQNIEPNRVGRGSGEVIVVGVGEEFKQQQQQQQKWHNQKHIHSYGNGFEVAG